MCGKMKTNRLVSVKNTCWLVLILSNLIVRITSKEVCGKATAVLSNSDGTKGIIYFTEMDNQVTYITGNLFHLTPGPHAFHLHTFGDIRNNCQNIGPHYNPLNLENGGDLGNVQVGDDGTAEISMSVTSQMQLFGKNSCIGRAIVVHAEADRTGHEASNANENNENGVPKVSCGVIGIQEP